MHSPTTHPSATTARATQADKSADPLSLEDCQAAYRSVLEKLKAYGINSKPTASQVAIAIGVARNYQEDRACLLIPAISKHLQRDEAFTLAQKLPKDFLISAFRSLLDQNLLCIAQLTSPNEAVILNAHREIERRLYLPAVKVQNASEILASFQSAKRQSAAHQSREQPKAEDFEVPPASGPAPARTGNDRNLSKTTGTVEKHSPTVGGQEASRAASRPNLSTSSFNFDALPPGIRAKIGHRSVRI